MPCRSLIYAVISVLVLAALPRASYGHAFPDHAEPRVGSTISAAPSQVRIWFTAALEPAFSTIIVQNAASKKVDKGDGRVNPADPTLLETSLPTLSSGTYKVIWNVAARDGHRTIGDFTFVIK
ncbi:MAG: copper resistance protein CopC [Nitrospirae bacterium]|nr:copper resistance protein CopC [Nitrospirota bacterium]